MGSISDSMDDCNLGKVPRHFLNLFFLIYKIVFGLEWIISFTTKN